MDEFPVDGKRMPMMVMQVFEYRGWENTDNGRQKSETQSKTKDGVPIWELVCGATFGRKSDMIRVRMPAAASPELVGQSVDFVNLRMRQFARKNGDIGNDFFADEAKVKASA